MSNDLISRKALQTSIRREPEIIVDGLPYIRADAVSAKISMAPVARAEVEHARWVYRKDGWYCSGCRKKARLTDVRYGKHCCSCGAKMDRMEVEHG